MALESGTYIDSLVATNPTGTDDRSQGDDHLRLIKSTIKNTFPNVTGAVTATHTELNLLAGQTSIIPPGVITLWAGSEGSIPSGWQLCNGSGLTTAGDAVPDLRDKFVVGATSTYAIGATGGQATPTISATSANHILTVDQIPSHTHDYKHGPYGGDSTVVTSNAWNGNGDPNQKTRRTLSTGGGQGHNHTVNVTNPANSNLPPYYALAYIIKL